MYTLLNELTNLAEAMNVFESQTMLLVDNDQDRANEIYESASIEAAKILKGLKSGDWSPSTEQIYMAAAIELLSDRTSREAITDAIKGGSNSIQSLLKAAGENEKANKILFRMVKQYGQSLPAKIQKEFDNASSNDEAKKALIMKYGKLLDVIGRIQTGALKQEPEKETDIKDWFK